jgi:hypothetical protein
MTLIIEPIIGSAVMVEPRTETYATKPPAMKPLEGPNSSFRITEQLCACGCGNAMPSTIVERGWQFLRGHKQGAGVVHGSAAPKPRALPAGPVKSISMADVLSFLKANQALLSAQEAQRQLELDGLNARTMQLVRSLYELRQEKEKLIEALLLLEPASPPAVSE